VDHVGDQLQFFVEGESAFDEFAAVAGGDDVFAVAGFDFEEEGAGKFDGGGA
jgi:hypothetical protein